MSQLIKIVVSPYNSQTEIAGDIVIQLHVPYSDKDVTIQVNPNIQEYTENADSENVKVRHVMLTTQTDQTKTLLLDFDANKSKSFSIAEKNYTIELMNIGKENIKGQDFKFFEFSVSES